MRRTFDCGVSSFGSCWGVQIAAVALGGTVALSPKGREVGIGRKVSLTPEGRGHPMYTGKKSCFHAFMSHGDEVVIPPSGAVITSSNDHSRIQGMAVTRNGTESWFVQYHPEYDLKYYAQLIGARKERMTAMGFFKNEEQIDLYVEDFTALHDEGAEVRKDVAWQYGIDEDIWNMDLRQCEARNWLKHIASLKFEPAY
jgi:GMP synthase (glutamine-hydrolysing)